MTVDELIEHTLLDSGQYVADITATLLDKPRFITMVDKEIAYYSKYSPKIITTSGDLYNNKVFQLANDPSIPDQITSIRRRTSPSILFNGSRIHGQISNYFWKYENPVLYFSLPRDIYEYSYTEKHTYDLGTDSYPSITLTDAKFLNLVLGRFLMMVGKSRRSFILSDIPITSDASEMVQEGQEIHNAAKDSLKEGGKFWEAILI